MTRARWRVVPGGATIHRRARVAAVSCSSANRITSRCGDECEHVAKAERDRLATAQAAQDGPGTTEAPAPDNPGGAPAAGFWARVRRVFGGE